MKYLINAKPILIKEVWGTLTKRKLPLVEKLCFSKVRMIFNQVELPKKTSLCTHYKKTEYFHFRCYTRFLKRFEYQMNRLMNDFNSLKINILNNGKGIKPIISLEVNLVPLSHHLGPNKFGWERICQNVKLCSMPLKLIF